MNNIYVMYIMLCESLISMLLLFKSTNKKKKNKKGLKSPWTRKFSGRGDITSVSFSEQGRLVQEDDEVKTLDKTKWFCPRPAHGRVNIPHVQPMDEEMPMQV